MATQATYYLDAPSFGSATVLYSDVNLTTVAPDGFYSDGTIVREQVSGVLLPQTTCASCVSYNCVDGTCIDPGDGSGTYATLLECETACTPPPPECPDRRVVFQICNSNSAIDDNFDIYLNNVYIGAVDLNSNAQVGSVFIADLNTSVELGSSDFVCPLSGMVTYHFDPAIVLGSNVLEMRNTQNNGNGNFGTVGVRNYSLSGTTLSNPCVIADLQYSGGSGSSFTFNFDYTACCPESYDCVDGNCVDPGDGSGAYATLAECEAACTAPPPPPALAVTSVSGYMEPCIGGTIDDHMGASVMLNNPVVADTTFDVQVTYTIPPTTCGSGGTTYTQSFTVEILAGQAGSAFNACTNGYYIASGANICSACITSCSDPAIVLTGFTC